MSLFRKDPLVMAHSTGSSRDARNPVAFSALTARSSPRMPAVLRVAILLVTATSSINAAISPKTAKKPDAIVYNVVVVVKVSILRQFHGVLMYFPQPSET